MAGLTHATMPTVDQHYSMMAEHHNSYVARMEAQQQAAMLAAQQQAYMIASQQQAYMISQQHAFMIASQQQAAAMGTQHLPAYGAPQNMGFLTTGKYAITFLFFIGSNPIANT